MLADKDRIFTNLYGIQSAGLEAARKRGDWDGARALMDKGRDWIIDEMKASGHLGLFVAGVLSGLMWSLLTTAAIPRPCYVIINADACALG